MKKRTNLHLLSLNKLFSSLASLVFFVLFASNVLGNKPVLESGPVKCAVTSNSYLQILPVKQQNYSADTVYKEVEQVPSFPGGLEKMYQFLGKNVRHPGKTARVNPEGLVIAKFIVTGQGKITNLKIEKSLTPEADAETLRVINLMPDWEPGKQNGKPVKVEYQLPIRFTNQ